MEIFWGFSAADPSAARYVSDDAPRLTDATGAPPLFASATLTPSSSKSIAVSRSTSPGTITTEVSSAPELIGVLHAMYAAPAAIAAKTPCHTKLRSFIAHSAYDARAACRTVRP